MAGGAELLEIDVNVAPAFTKSMGIAQHDLKLDRLFVVYPGATSYRLREGAEVIAIRELGARLVALGR